MPDTYLLPYILGFFSLMIFLEVNVFQKQVQSEQDTRDMLCQQNDLIKLFRIITGHIFF